MLQSCDSLVTILPRLQGFWKALHVILIPSWFAAQKQHSAPGRIRKIPAGTEDQASVSEIRENGQPFYAAKRRLKNESCPSGSLLKNREAVTTAAASVPGVPVSTVR